MNKFYKIFFILCFILVFTAFYFLYSSCVLAATLYFQPAVASYKQGEIFSQEIRVDNEGENLNAFSIYLNYPSEFMVVKDVNLGNSIINFVVAEPVVDEKKGIISFAGIVPGGYNGRIVGDPGLTNLIAKIIFEVKKQSDLSENTKINIQFNKQTAVLLNDGKATPVEVNKKESQITILNQIISQEKQASTELDKITPEISPIEISRSPDIFNNQWFAVFSAEDKDSGIAYYQIQETSKNRPDENNWLIAKSPYLLGDQELKSYIFVQVVDKAGNKKLIVKQPSKEVGFFSNYIIYVIILILVLALFWLLFKGKIKRRNKYQNDSKA